MKVSIIHSSRSRPEVAYQTAKCWLERFTPSSNFHLKYILGVEVVDIPQYAPFISKLQDCYGNLIQVRFITGKRIELSEMYAVGFQFPSETEMPNYLTANTKGNLLIRENSSDWLITIADNFLPQERWNLLMKQTLENLKGKIALVGYQNELSRSLVAHSAFTKEFIAWNGGHLMYEGYYHTHGDSELFIKANRSKCLYSFPQEIIPIHNHPLINNLPADDLFRLNNDMIVYAQAEPIFQRRKRELLD